MKTAIGYSIRDAFKCQIGDWLTDRKAERSPTLMVAVRESVAWPNYYSRFRFEWDGEKFVRRS